MNKVKRLEVIDETGRVYTNYGVEDLELDYQDDGRTLKIFVRSSDEKADVVREKIRNGLAESLSSIDLDGIMKKLED